ncbi:MAG: hypothetical protein KDB14_30700 [Planctomycetales bacterium]|nr:hypothetical protein [Planctomycetales bacterium]
MMAKREISDAEILELLGTPPPPTDPRQIDPYEMRRENFHSRVATWLIRRVSIDDVRAIVTPKTLPRVIDEIDQFIDSALRGDEFWEFSCPQSEWDRLTGRAGYALVRDGVVVDVLAQ